MKTGIHTGTIIRPKTAKQKRDQAKRRRQQKERQQYIENKIGKLIGKHVYHCSNCKNRVRLDEKIGDRKILCTKCNAGFYTTE